MIKIDLNYLKEIFEADIITIVENKRFPGMAMSIIENGTKIYSFDVGYRDIEKCKEFNGDTLVRFGSITEAFTSLAILLLEDQGKLSVDDPIVKYLSINPRTKKHQITIHHLLTQTQEYPFI